jgi:hypothetical protein
MAVYQRFVGAIRDANRHLFTITQIAFHNFLLLYVPLDSAEGAGKQAGPAADAFILIDCYDPAPGITVQCAGQTVIKAGSVFAILATQGKGYRFPYFYGAAG